VRVRLKNREQNRERTNRMLALMQLHANGQDDVHAYTHLIRAWLEGTGGRPGVDRCAIVDHSGSAWLR
jgi:hypothetical protein